MIVCLFKSDLIIRGYKKLRFLYFESWLNRIKVVHLSFSIFLKKP